MTEDATWVRKLGEPERQRILHLLDGLVETCHDAHAGYLAASDRVHEPELKQLFTLFASQRAEFARALSALVARMGGAPRAAGSIGGRVHRVWLEVASTISRGSAVSLLTECERGEHAAFERYRAALTTELPMPVEELLIDHLDEIRKAHDDLDRMRRP